MITIELNNEQLSFAGRAGELRARENQNTPDINEYGPGATGFSNTEVHRLGVITEMAVLKWLGLDPCRQSHEVWNPFCFREQYNLYMDNRPDIAFNGTLYEVRRANEIGNPLPIRVKDIEVSEDMILIQTYVETFRENGKFFVNPEVQLLGYAYAHEIRSPKAVRPRWARDFSRVIDAHPMEGLMIDA